MQSSLKKSLYLGLAALSFVSVAAVSTTASAKSYAKAGAYTVLKADATKRNVEATGTNALYTKPGTVKGAKVVASKATMAKLASSKKSADYFRAYGQKVTNRGSVYYRVVTMDGKYRGYVYGGKTEATFAGGVKKAETTTKAAMPAKTTGYYLNDTTKNTLWTAPKYTQYKASKVSLYGATKESTFTVDNAATKTREGSLYYHVVSDNDSSVSGWIYAGKGFDSTATGKQVLGGLSLTKSVTATDANSVKIAYRTADNKVVGNATWVTNTDKTVAGTAVATDPVAPAKTGDLALLNTYANANVPAGYKAATALTTDAPTALLIPSALYGNTYYVPVTKSAASKVSLKVTTVTDPTTATKDPFHGGVKSDSDNVTTNTLVGNNVNVTIKAADLSTLNDALTGNDNTNLSSKAITAAFGGISDMTSATTYYAKNVTDGAYHYEYKFETADGNNGNTTLAGNTVTADVIATAVQGAAGVSAANNAWLQ